MSGGEGRKKLRRTVYGSNCLRLHLHSLFSLLVLRTRFMREISMRCIRRGYVPYCAVYLIGGGRGIGKIIWLFNELKQSVALRIYSICRSNERDNVPNKNKKANKNAKKRKRGRADKKHIHTPLAGCFSLAKHLFATFSETLSNHHAASLLLANGFDRSPGRRKPSLGWKQTPSIGKQTQEEKGG